MKMKKIIFILLLLVLNISCDPPHNIYFINQSASETKVKIKLNPNVENYKYQLEEISKGDSIIFYIKPKDTADIYFGIGDWSGNEIEKVLKSIKSIEIETDDIKTLYKTKKSMKKILENNKKGIFFKTRIEIEIE